MPLAPGAVNGQNKTRIRGPGFGHKPLNPTRSPPLGLPLQVYQGLVCKHKRRVAIISDGISLHHNRLTRQYRQYRHAT